MVETAYLIFLGNNPNLRQPQNFIGEIIRMTVFVTISCQNKPNFGHC